MRVFICSAAKSAYQYENVEYWRYFVFSIARPSEKETDMAKFFSDCDRLEWPIIMKFGGLA